MNKPWEFFTMCQADEGDIGQIFTLAFQMTTVAGTELGTGRLDFTMTNLSHNLNLSIPGIPVGQEGRISIRFWLERDGQRITAEHENWIVVKYAD